MTRTQSDTTNKKRSFSQLRSFYFAFTSILLTRPPSPIKPPHTVSAVIAAASRSAMPHQLPPSITPSIALTQQTPPPPCTAPSCHSAENEQEGKSYPAGRTKQNPLKLKNTPRFFPQKMHNNYIL